MELIVRDADILGGVPVFAGTRVPVQTLFDYIQANHALTDFLDDFPAVDLEQAQAVLQQASPQIRSENDLSVRVFLAPSLSAISMPNRSLASWR